MMRQYELVEKVRSYDPAADERDPGPGLVRSLLEGLLPLAAG